MNIVFQYLLAGLTCWTAYTVLAVFVLNLLRSKQYGHLGLSLNIVNLFSIVVFAIVSAVILTKDVGQGSFTLMGLVLFFDPLWMISTMVTFPLSIIMFATEASGMLTVIGRILLSNVLITGMILFYLGDFIQKNYMKKSYENLQENEKNIKTKMRLYFKIVFYAALILFTIGVLLKL